MVHLGLLLKADGANPGHICMLINSKYCRRMTAFSVHCDLLCCSIQSAAGVHNHAFHYNLVVCPVLDILRNLLKEIKEDNGRFFLTACK